MQNLTTMVAWTRSAPQDSSDRRQRGSGAPTLVEEILTTGGFWEREVSFL